MRNCTSEKNAKMAEAPTGSLRNTQIAQSGEVQHCHEF